MTINYKIYMLSDDNPNLFLGTSMIKNVSPITDYRKVYEGNIDLQLLDIMPEATDYYILENIFKELNVNHPSDYKCHSLSISDVVEFFGKYYFCDSFDWIQLDW